MLVLLLFCGAAVGAVAGADAQIIFHANNSVNPEQTASQSFTPDTLITLNPVSGMEFTVPTGQKFIGWAIGNATSPTGYYTDRQAVTLSAGVVNLYAQWEGEQDVSQDMFTDGKYTISSNGYYQLKPSEGTVVTGNITVNSGVLAVLDLNGYVLKANSGSVITNNGVLTVTDSSSGKYHYFIVQDAGNPWVLNDTQASGTPLDQITDASQLVKDKVIEVTGGCITGGTGTPLEDESPDGGGVYVNGGTFNMSGGNIVGNSAVQVGIISGSGGGVYMHGGMFNMNGGNIAGNSAPDGGGVCVAGEFTMSGGTIVGNSAVAGGGVCVWAGGSFEMSGGSITGNSAGYGGGVYVNGSFTMSGGTIVGNSASLAGGGVCVTGTGSKFEMSGGNITGNRATGIEEYPGCGGGVYVAGEFEMSGGSITGNSAVAGGGVCVTGESDTKKGTFTMSGDAIIKGNTATGTADNNGGGGVFVAEYGEFEMTGGTIGGENADKNSATNGGGVYVTGRIGKVGTFTMSGTASIKGNEATGESDTDGGGGVYVDTYGTFNVSGTPDISGNTKGTEDDAPENNVWLVADKYITVTGALTAEPKSAKIGIANPLSGKFGAGSGYSVTAADAACFFQDGIEQVRGVVTGSNDLYWPVAKIVTSGATPVTTYYATVADAVTGADTNDTITMIADSEEPTVTVGKTVTLNLAGFVLKNNGSGTDKSVIKVESGRNLTVIDENPKGTPAAAEHYFKYVKDGAWIYAGDTEPEDKYKVFILNGTGANFTREAADAAVGSAPSGKSVYIKVTGGCITGGSANYGGGVYVNGGTFILNSGTIVGNTASGGNGVGGGVCVNGGTFTLNSGSITGNTAKMGGGVCVNGASSKFEMSGGNIVGNSAPGDGLGGGVCVVYSGTFTMQDSTDLSPTHGTITGNTARTDGGGVYVRDSTFEVSGAPEISGNTMGGNANNVYLYDSDNLKLTGNLTGGEIRITEAGAAPPSKGEPFGTTESVDYTGVEHFVADGDTPLVGSIETGTANLVWATPETTYTVTFNVQGHGNNFTQTVTSGSAATEPTAPTASGYTFGGWYTEPECTNEYIFTTPVTANITLYAKWTKNSSGGSSSHSGSSVWAQPISTVPGDNTVATDVTYQYTGQKFIPVSAANLEQISAADPAAAAAVEMVLQTASAAGIPVTNSKGAKALVNTTESIAGLQTETFAQIIDVKSADGTKVTSVPFKVRLSDLTAKNLTTDDVTLYHYLEEYGLWIPLETVLVSTDDVYAYYEAATDGASPFGVLLKKIDAPEVQPVPTQTGATPAPVAGVLAGLGAALAVFGLRMRR